MTERYVDVLVNGAYGVVDTQTNEVIASYSDESDAYIHAVRLNSCTCDNTESEFYQNHGACFACTMI